MKKLILCLVLNTMMSLGTYAKVPDATGLITLGDEPQLLVTAEYMTVDELTNPKVLALLKKYNVIVLPCNRAGHLDEELDRLYTTYEREGLLLVFWPLLPREQGLYLNKKHADDFYNYLDLIYEWADKYQHPIPAMVIDIEPPNYQAGTEKGPVQTEEKGVTFSQVLKDMDRKEFESAKAKFQKINDKLHQYGTISISTALDLSAIDLVTGKSTWQDLQGGPTMAVNWDYVSFMHFNSANYPTLRKFGLNWDDVRALSYLLGKVIYEKYGNRVGLSIGQTIPGEGKAPVYESPEELAKDVAVLKAAGIKHFCIYDLEGIVNSKDPEGWFKAVRETEPQKPKVTFKAKMFFSTLKNLSYFLELFRL